MAGIDTTVLSLAFLVVVSGLLLARRRHYPFRLLAPLLPVGGVVLIGLWRYSESARVLADDGRLAALLISLVVMLTAPILLADDRDLAGLNVVWILVGSSTAALALIIGGAAALWGRGGINDAYLGPAYLCGLGLTLAANAILTKSLPLVATLPAAILCGVALLATGSRGPLVAVAVALVAALILNSRRTGWYAAVAVTGAATMVGLSLASSASVANLTSPDLVRPRLAGIAYEAFLGSPFFGGGWGSFALDATSQGFVGIAYPHNLFLEFAAEYGVVGLTALAVVLGTAASRVIRTRWNPASVAAGVTLMYWLVGHQFSADITDRTFWLSVVVCLMTPALVKGDPGQDPSSQRQGMHRVGRADPAALVRSGTGAPSRAGGTMATRTARDTEGCRMDLERSHTPASGPDRGLEPTAATVRPAARTCSSIQSGL